MSNNPGAETDLNERSVSELAEKLRVTPGAMLKPTAKARVTTVFGEALEQLEARLDRLEPVVIDLAGKVERLIALDEQRRAKANDRLKKHRQNKGAS